MRIKFSLPAVSLLGIASISRAASLQVQPTPKLASWRLLVLLAGLLIAGMAKADSVTDLSGVLKSPGQIINYSFEVDTFNLIGPGGPFIEDLVVFGFVTVKGSGHPQKQIYLNDTFLFVPGESVILATFGRDPVWQLIGSADGIVLRDPIIPFSNQVTVPEPKVPLLMLVGLLAIVLLQRHKLA
jgi:hypothetical protein